VPFPIWDKKSKKKKLRQGFTIKITVPTSLPLQFILNRLNTSMKPYFNQSLAIKLIPNNF
jgi:hypothetical protein